MADPNIMLRTLACAVMTLGLPMAARAAAPAPAPPTACWDIVAANGERARLMMTRSGDAMSGSLLTPMATVPVQGRISGNTITFGGILSRMGQEMAVQYRGTLDRDRMQGSATTGDRDAAPFTATPSCSGEFQQPLLGWSTAPKPLDFNDHEGFVSIFDGTLAGWDGNPKFWRAEGGMIVGESSRANPSGNAYLTYRGMTARDFDLRMEIKLDHGGSGIQYRSRTGVPWRSAAPPEVVANAGPYDPKWMLTGPQADFWAPNSSVTNAFNGQVYSENTPIGIEAFTGQIVRQYGEDIARKKLVGTIAPSRMLIGFVNVRGWNQYEIIARGGVLIHIMNGQVMAVLVDDKADGTNQQPGLFGLEIEGETKVYARNIFVHKLN